MSKLIDCLAVIGFGALCFLAYPLAAWITQKGEQYAKAQEHRLNTPGCDASVRGKSYGEDWSETRCARGVYVKP